MRDSRTHTNYRNGNDLSFSTGSVQDSGHGQTDQLYKCEQRINAMRYCVQWTQNRKSPKITYPIYKLVEIVFQKDRKS
jgi:hypothetical protein